jgi:hypothetical protein
MCAFLRGAAFEKENKAERGMACGGGDELSSWIVLAPTTRVPPPYITTRKAAMVDEFQIGL